MPTAARGAAPAAADRRRDAPAGDFDMAYWSVPEDVSDSPCGFAGCAIGWLCHLKAIPGLVLSDSWPVYMDSFSRIECFSFSAVAKAFGLDEDLAVYLFDPDSYARPTGLNEVIERMRQVAGLLAKSQVEG